MKRKLFGDYDMFQQEGWLGGDPRSNYWLLQL